MISLPQLFLGGFLWEGFALSTSAADDSLIYYMLAGLGEFSGNFLGHILVYFLIGSTKSTVRYLISASLLSSGCFWTGFFWQLYVNIMYDNNLYFPATFVIIWCLIGLTYLIMTTLYRYLYPIVYGKENVPHHDFYYDLQLSFSVGCGAACFVGTSVGGEFEYNWFEPVFGLAHEDVNPILAMLKSGASMCLGFMIAQSFQNAAFVKFRLWTDAEDE